MLLAALALTLTPAPQASPAEITLNSEDRWALITGLRYRLGGPFVIANLADAEVTCKTSSACLTATALELGQIEQVDLSALVAGTEVGGHSTVAIVALRTGEITREGLRLTVSVFEPSTSKWANKDLWINSQNTSSVDGLGIKRISRYEDSTVL